MSVKGKGKLGIGSTVKTGDMLPQQEIEVMEITKAEAMGAIKRRDDLLALIKDPRFDKIIMQGYFEAEPSRLVLMKSDPNMKDKDNQKMLDRQIIGCGMLNQYFHVIIAMGNNAEKTVEDSDNAIEELAGEIANQAANKKGD